MEFYPKRNMQQKVHLLPYLFASCMEHLAHSIQKAIAAYLWLPFKLTKTRPLLSHLFFEDDLILFVKISIS